MTKEELRDYYREYSKERYEWRKSHKICAMCGKEKATSNRTLCDICLLNMREKSAEIRKSATAEQKGQMKQYKHKYYEKFIESGICPRCRIRPLQENRKKCSVCLEKQRKRRGE